MLPQIHEKYVKTGKVELVFVDLPLQMHRYAFVAARAAACAGDLSKFWEMHHQLFANQRALAPAQLRGHAEELGLDLASFDTCLAGGKHDGEIREDVRLANSFGFSGTLAFLLGRRAPKSDKVEVLDVVKGLPPYEELAKRLDALLAAP